MHCCTMLCRDVVTSTESPKCLRSLWEATIRIFFAFLQSLHLEADFLDTIRSLSPWSLPECNSCIELAKRQCFCRSDQHVVSVDQSVYASKKKAASKKTSKPLLGRSQVQRQPRHGHQHIILEGVPEGVNVIVLVDFQIEVESDRDMIGDRASHSGLIYSAERSSLKHRHVVLEKQNVEDFAF